MDHICFCLVLFVFINWVKAYMRLI